MIVGISGEIGSGKSTAAEILIEQGYIRGKFAGALKDMLRALLRYRGADDETIERMIEGDLKEKSTRLLNGRSPRYAMQTLGTEWGRDLIHPDLWVDTEMEAKADVPKLLFDDVRHPNEADAIRARGGVLAHLTGRGGDSTGHSSEGFVPEGAAIISNTGSVEHLRGELLAVTGKTFL
jgi:hypothetical protein